MVAPPPPIVVSSKSPARKTGVSSAKATVSQTATATAGSVDANASAHLSSGKVYGDHDVMLNQTDLKTNKNKFYKAQVVHCRDGCYVFTRWGRVGESGATQENGPFDSAQAVKEFAKKFKTKSKNKWEGDRQTTSDNFVPIAGAYALVDMESDEADAANTMARVSAASGSVSRAPCTLDKVTQDFVEFIFDEDMFKSAMSALELDPTKLPLGALGKPQLDKGYAALSALKNALSGGSGGARGKSKGRGKSKAAASTDDLDTLTSKFYTIIPHAFGRGRPPTLDTESKVQAKFDMLNVLADIEAAQAMTNIAAANDAGGSKSSKGPSPHLTDLNYTALGATLTPVEAGDEDDGLIRTYLANTQPQQGGGGRCGKMGLAAMWRVDRQGEDQTFAAHSDLNHKLLWHGTNAAVVAAILKSGLRIMPHSGGRVGKGIYLADQHEKSASYVQVRSGGRRRRRRRETVWDGCMGLSPYRMCCGGCLWL